MPDTYHFPVTEPTDSAAKNWVITIGPALVPVIVRFNSLPYWIFGAVILLFNVFVTLLPFKRPLQVSIDTDARQLHYVYENLAGHEHTLTLNLRNIRGYYERERQSRLTFEWHLVLYNQWGLYKKLSIKEGNGYTHEQLDQIVKLINRCKDSVV
ncbi:hypothetical protein [Mucilaginibacter sp. CSA2-8R]|uniref:hypothetical protein n=1 Tax=Mucilaginibacter sp. CSA2-8R TaxID=3141542 RepID=UPI00315DCA16